MTIQPTNPNDRIRRITGKIAELWSTHPSADFMAVVNLVNAGIPKSGSVSDTDLETHIDDLIEQERGE